MIEKLESGELNQNEIDRVIYHKKYREVIVHRMAEEYKSVLPSHVYNALKISNVLERGYNPLSF